MYYKKQGIEPPVIKAGCVYIESYLHDGYLFLKYAMGNIPSEELIEIAREEYETNKPAIPEPETELEPGEQEILQAEMLLNQQQIISKQTEIDMTLAELLLNQQGVGR